VVENLSQKGRQVVHSQASGLCCASKVSAEWWDGTVIRPVEQRIILMAMDMSAVETANSSGLW
jgi:hypothetical protein